MKEKSLNDTEKIEEINGIIGAFDNRTLDRVKKLCKYLRVYQWAVQRLEIINDLSDRDIAKTKKKETLNKLKTSLDEIDKVFLDGGKSD